VGNTKKEVLPRSGGNPAQGNTGNERTVVW